MTRHDLDWMWRLQPRGVRYSIGFLKIAISCLLLLGTTNKAAAGPAEIVRFHGVISQLQGSSPTDGTYMFRVEIFDVATGGTPLLSIDSATLVESSMYTLTLSPAQPGDINTAFAEGPRFIETTVLSGPAGAINEVLTPRQEVASVPFAITGGNQIVPTPHLTETQVKTWAAEVQQNFSVVSDDVGTTSCTNGCHVDCLAGATPIACSFRKNSVVNVDADVVGCMPDIGGGRCSFWRDIQNSADGITLYCTCQNP